jgi:hypothetical protein
MTRIPQHSRQRFPNFVACAILAFGSLFGVKHAAQTPAPAAPKLSEIVYPKESDGSVGTGVKPGMQITLKGDAFRDPAEQNPKPTKVSFMAPDPADARKTKPIEVDPDEISSDNLSLKVTVPSTALAGAVRVQWGGGDGAVKSEPQSANIRFSEAHLLSGGIDEYQYFNNSTTDTQQFLPDNRLAYKGGLIGFTSLQCVNRYQNPPPPDLSQSATQTALMNPGGVLLAHGNDGSSGCDPWYDSWYLPGLAGPRMRCVQNFQKCSNKSWWARYDLDYTVKADLTLGPQELVDGESVRVASGEILRNNICNDTVELRKTNPDGTFSWTVKLDYKAAGVVWYYPPWNGPAGHAFFATSRGIARFKPDGSFQDFASYATPGLAADTSGSFMPSAEDPVLKRVSPERRQALLDAIAKESPASAVASCYTGWSGNGGQEVDCAGNLFWVQYYTDSSCGNSMFAPRRLMKLPFNATQAVVVDPDLRTSMMRDGVKADNARLTGINQFGDIYFEGHWRTNGWFSQEASCISSHSGDPNWYLNPPADDGEFLIRNPKTRAEACEDSKYSLEILDPRKSHSDTWLRSRLP